MYKLALVVLPGLNLVRAALAVPVVRSYKKRDRDQALVAVLISSAECQTSKQVKLAVKFLSALVAGGRAVGLS